MATESSIKLRTTLRGSRLTVQALIRHPMEVGRRKDGEHVEPHFIVHVACTLDDRLVLDADWGGGIARDPYLSFEIDGVSTGSVLVLRWEDNHRMHDEARAQV